MSGWTKGPWVKKTQRVKNADEWQIVGDGWGVANVSPLLRAGGYTEGESNANLIAAAPDLYEALEGLLAVAPAKAPASGLIIGIDKQHAAAITAARAALAKARGEGAES